MRWGPRECTSPDPPPGNLALRAGFAVVVRSYDASSPPEERPFGRVQRRNEWGSAVREVPRGRGRPGQRSTDRSSRFGAGSGPPRGSWNFRDDGLRREHNPRSREPIDPNAIVVLHELRNFTRDCRGCPIRPELSQQLRVAHIRCRQAILVNAPRRSGQAPPAVSIGGAEQIVVATLEVPTSAKDLPYVDAQNRSSHTRW